MKQVLNSGELQALLLPLLGLPVSRPWRAYGNAVYLELGELSLSPLPRGRCAKYGEANIGIRWEWRLEDDVDIVCGTSNSIPKIDACVRALLGVRITALTVESAPPELTVSFSNGQRLRSMAMVSGCPQWAVVLPDRTYVCCEAARLVQKSGDEPFFEFNAEEQELARAAEEAAIRWGCPRTEPARGECWDCRNFIRLDSDFSLLDYGVCGQIRSPYDGRVVNVKSGCSFFEGMSG